MSQRGFLTDHHLRLFSGALGAGKYTVGKVQNHLFIVKDDPAAGIKNISIIEDICRYVSRVTRIYIS